MPDHRISAHDAALVSKAIDRLAPRWTTWTLQTIAQHGQMRLTKIAAALPWLSTQNTQQILRQMHANGLLDRPDRGVYEVSPSGRNAHSVHRTLAFWHRTHFSGSGPAVAEAERTENALRRLRGEGAVDVLHALSEHGPLPHGELRQASGLATGSFYYRIRQLQADQLLARAGSSFGAAYTLTPAAQALGPIYGELAAFESMAPSVAVQRKPAALATTSTARANAAVRRTPAALPGLFSHASAPPATCPGTRHGALPPLTDQVIRMPTVRPRRHTGARAHSRASRAGARAPPPPELFLMPTTGPRAFRPDSDVLIAPVYLAGPGPGEPVFNTLDSAASWTKVVAFGEDTYYTSPCQRVRIANVMDSHYGGWTFSYAEDPLGVPDWITTFDRDTPREIVAAFTDTLVAGLPNNFADYLSGGKHHTGHTPATVLSSHQWEAVRGTRPFRMVSPDGHSAYRMRGGWLHEYDELLDPEKSTWRMSAGPDPISAPSWQAYFSRGTPEHLITATADALIDPRPVVRAAFLIPDRHRSLVEIQPLRPDQATSRSTAALARSSRTNTVHQVQPAPAATAPVTPVIAGSRRQR